MTTLKALCIGTWILVASTAEAASVPVTKPAPETMTAAVPAVAPGNSLHLTDSVSQGTLEDLGRYLGRLASDEANLGDTRRRRLWIARSYLPRLELGAVPHDDVRIEEEVEEIIGHCVLKLLRVRAEERLGLTDLRQRHHDRRHGDVAEEGRRWSLDPRAGVGHDPWLGSKLRWRHLGERSSWRHGDVSLGVKQHLLHDELAVGLEWQNDDLKLGLEHIWDSEDSGDVYRLSLRWRL